ncbi:uncharacterized protein LOC113791597 [Dermatophagoides pteronyssinus]|uniref:uncharacterized protein LOC113791597 n=1 Tax=Dermatophagoides pteronyssinus TaxID=6956 RepID=UPI003F667BD9
MFITNPYVTYPQRSLLHRYHFGRRAAIGEKHEHMFLRAIGKAMQYYRIWIYSCNAALFIGTFIYVVAFITVITDSRLSLFPNIRLYHPSFIYAYLAIIIQGGLVQAIGCLGALKLNESYLHLYLVTMSILVFGDAIVGVAWALRYKNITMNLKSDLKNQIFNEYDTNIEIRNVWDDIQVNWNCCGVDGPTDYNVSTWALRYLPLPESQHLVLPLSCCHPEEPTFGPPHNECITKMNEHVFSNGCYEHIYLWLQNSTDLLLVLGFCVITFVKLCFLFLLRSEIKEMIEKIKVIKGETSSDIPMLPFQDIEAYLPRPSMQQQQDQTAIGTTTMLLNPSSTTTAATNQHPMIFRGNSTQERCHCRLSAASGYINPTNATAATNLINTLTGSRTILSYSAANLAACQSFAKKHSIV